MPGRGAAELEAQLTASFTLPRPQRIWGEWQKLCLKECDDDVRRYWVCREEEGLMAPIRCGEQNKAMNACLAACGRDEERFGAFRARRLDEIEDEILARQAAAAAAAKAAPAGAAPPADGASPLR